MEKAAPPTPSLDRNLDPNYIFRPLLIMVRRSWDLNLSLPQPGTGPFRGLAGVINQLLGKLRDLMRRISAGSVAVSRQAPQLAEMAGNLADGAALQASQAAQIAQAAHDLEEAVVRVAQSTEEATARSEDVAGLTAKLHRDSANIGEIMNVIGKVATQTRLLAINAAVEAARAGQHGQGFMVVAREVQRLADETMRATQRVGGILDGISTSVRGLVEAVGGEGDAAGQQNLRGLMRRIQEASGRQATMVEEVSEGIRGVAGTAQAQSEGSQDLSRVSQTLREASAELLMAVGVFRLEAHKKAAGVLESHLLHPDLLSLRRPQMERLLDSLIQRYPFFELLYVTDARGIQITANVGARESSAAGESALGKNWSQRPWFLGALEGDGVYVSDLYRSVATDNFCFTVSSRLTSLTGDTVGVIAADVSFGDIAR